MTPLEEAEMSEREMLIKEINELPDFVVSQLSGIVHYLKIGVDNEYVPDSTNEFYSSDHFSDIVRQSIAEYRGKNTVDMDL